MSEETAAAHKSFPDVHDLVPDSLLLLPVYSLPVSVSRFQGILHLPGTVSSVWRSGFSCGDSAAYPVFLSPGTGISDAVLPLSCCLPQSGTAESRTRTGSEALSHVSRWPL